MTKNMAITADYDNMSFTDLLAYKAKIDRIGLRKDAEKRLGITRGLQNM